MANNTIFKAFIMNYWLYYRELEDELLSTQKYVYFHSDNFNTYSVGLLKLYQAICSEIDVIGKSMAAYVNENFVAEDSSNNILKWWYEIQSAYAICSGDRNNVIALKSRSEVFMDIITITPWKDFEIEEFTDSMQRKRYRHKNCTTPSWWADYNKVKHNRTSQNADDATKINFCKANLGNVCYALTALYILESAYMQKLGTQNELEAFADYSKCFTKKENATSEEIRELFFSTN